VHSVVVPRGNRPVRPLPTAADPVGIVAMRITNAVGEVQAIQETLTATYTHAFVVVHQGVVVCEWYAQPKDEWQRHPLHSVTKSFVGTLAGQLIGMQALDADRIAADYVPDLLRGGYATARVQDLLDMRTGGDYVELHDEVDSELFVMGQIVGWLPLSAQLGAPSIRALAAHTQRVAIPGGPFSYRSLDTEVLAWVLEAAAHTPLVTLLADNLIAPLGLELAAELTVDPAGTPLASGGLAMMPRDLARFGQMLLDGGSVGDVEVVPPLFLKDTRWGAEDSVNAFAQRVGERIGPTSSSQSEGLYRNQFWVPRRGGRQLLCLGVHGQAVLIDGDNQVVAVKLSHWPTAQNPSLFTDGLSCLTAAAEALGGRPTNSMRLL
jgi:CubicO group peptidase (beta-lactamase class C family)